MQLFLFICIITSIQCFSPQVKTNKGKLLGTTYTLPNGRVINAFLGIPYAAPPVERARFQEPKPMKNWSGLRNATMPNNICIQFPLSSTFHEMIGSEDCLYLNVYSPKLPKNNQLENDSMNVMVYIHGGGYTVGNGYKIIPDYILQNDDIVFVSINFRLGPLGFFSSGDSIVPGNNGLKDQVAALRWVKENILYFGGNPEKVTLYGSSSGAFCVHFHLLSRLSEGLFQSAISSSGSALQPSALPRNVVKNSFKLASMINCPTSNSRLMMNCMKKKSLDEIYETSYQLVGKFMIDFSFGPVVEPKNEGAFLHKHPFTLLKNGEVKNIPFMTSVVEIEGSVPALKIFFNYTKMNELINEWDDLAPHLFLYYHIRSRSELDNISASIRKHYFGSKKISNETIKELLQAVGDRLHTNGIFKAAKMHSSMIQENTYCYKLFYRAAGSHSDYFYNSTHANYGVCHGDDQFYLINFADKKFNRTKNDLDMAKLLTSYIVAFMKNKNPSTSDTSWQSMSKNNTMNCLNIYSYTYQRMEIIENDDKSDQFWNSLPINDYD